MLKSAGEISNPQVAQTCSFEYVGTETLNSENLSHSANTSISKSQIQGELWNSDL